MIKAPPVPPAARLALRKALMDHDLDPGRVDEIVDLVIHASEQSIQTLLRITGSSPDFAITLAATSVALSVTKARCGEIIEAMVFAANKTGVRHFTAEVSIKR